MVLFSGHMLHFCAHFRGHKLLSKIIIKICWLCRLSFDRLTCLRGFTLWPKYNWFILRLPPAWIPVATRVIRKNVGRLPNWKRNVACKRNLLVFNFNIVYWSYFFKPFESYCKKIQFSVEKRGQNMWRCWQTDKGGHKTMGAQFRRFVASSAYELYFIAVLFLNKHFIGRGLGLGEPLRESIPVAFC